MCISAMGAGRSCRCVRCADEMVAEKVMEPRSIDLISPSFP
jgi:hypothetical protein